MAAFNGITLPVITDNGLSDARERRQILEALANLSKQLKHVLANLDAENLAPDMQEKIETAYQKAETSVNGINQVVEGMGGMRSRLTQAENNITAAVENAEGLESRLAITEKGVAISVKQGEVISFINQSPEEITIMANKISLNGAVSANGTFLITPEGYLVCTGGQIGDLVVGSSDISVINRRPLCVGKITLSDDIISGVTRMPHLQLTKYNMGMDEVTPSDTAFVVMRPDGTLSLRDIYLRETMDDQGLPFYYLDYSDYGGESSSTGGGVVWPAVRISKIGKWYTDAACTIEGGDIAPNEVYRVQEQSGPSSTTNGVLYFNGSTGFWKRSDRVVRYLKPETYIETSVRLVQAND